MYTQGVLINTVGFFDETTTMKQTALFATEASFRFYVEAVIINEELRNFTDPIFEKTRQAGIIHNAPDATADLA